MRTSNHGRKSITLLWFTMLAFLSVNLTAQNSRISKSVLDAAGGSSASANYWSVNAAGQPTPIGTSQSTTYRVSAGFLAGGGVFNQAPILVSITNQQVNEGDTLEVQLTASDPNNDDITFNVENLPAFGSLTDNGDGTGNIRFTPSSQDAGVYPGITVIAVDNGFPRLADTSVFTLTVLEALAVGEQGSEIPREYELMQNYPNPFNPSTTIRFALPKGSNVKLEIFDIQGKLVTTLLDDQREAGYHSVKWDAKSAASGIYFYRIKAKGFVMTRSMMFLK